MTILAPADAPAQYADAAGTRQENLAPFRFDTERHHRGPFDAAFNLPMSKAFQHHRGAGHYDG